MPGHLSVTLGAAGHGVSAASNQFVALSLALFPGKKLPEGQGATACSLTSPRYPPGRLTATSGRL